MPSDQRSRLMSRIRGRGNRTTELRLVKLLRAAKISGWRRHLPLPGRPDFCFPAARMAVFVDGCFWHGCPRCKWVPKSNQGYWRPKLEMNRQRDLSANRELRRLGWKVIRIWEHSLKHNLATVLSRMQALLTPPAAAPAAARRPKAALPPPLPAGRPRRRASAAGERRSPARRLPARGSGNRR